MSTNALKAAATGRAPANPVTALSSFLNEKLKPQLALALPKHLTPDRMCRLALTSFSTTPALQKCTPISIASSVMTAGQLGLEIGVNGQGFLVPYGTTCTFVPGWKGLVDLVSRSGRATVYTGVIYSDQRYTYSDGSQRELIVHDESDLDDPNEITHFYAVGWVNGSSRPIIELWRAGKVRKHRDKYNKVGQRHYSFRDWEMYARKVPLLQVLKYLPSSVEVSNAIAVADAAEMGQRADILDGFVTVSDIDGMEGDMNAAAFIERINSAADRASAEAMLQQSLAYGLPEADAAQVEKAFAKKWPGTETDPAGKR